MGTRAAPNFANVYMGQFEDTFVYRTEWSHFLIDWVRFIDDIFTSWYDVSHAMGFRGWGRNSIKNHSLTHSLTLLDN